MWNRDELIEIVMMRGLDKLAAATKVDRCLAQVRQEPMLAAMYFHDMLGLEFGYINIKENENGETGHC